jgi:pSer/pThr/pTyr-binding forkhead associated (FHA) protein
MAVIIQTVDGVIVNRFEIDEAGLSFGRAASNQVQIDDTAVSTNHAEIVIEESDEGKQVYVIRDIGSTNGTFLNEQKVERQPLRHKDIIRVGWNNFVFIDENQRDHERTDKITKSWIPGIYYKENNQ